MLEVSDVIENESLQTATGVPSTDSVTDHLQIKVNASSPPETMFATCLGVLYRVPCVQRGIIDRQRVLLELPW